MALRQPIPDWARRRAEQHEAERAERWNARMAPLFSDLLPVDALWSNGSLEPFCLACVAFVPVPFIEMGLPPETTCARCGEAVGARKAG